MTLRPSPKFGDSSIELDGMRYLTSHRRVVALKERFALGTCPLAVVDDSKTNLYYLRCQNLTAADWGSAESGVPLVRPLLLVPSQGHSELVLYPIWHKPFSDRTRKRAVTAGGALLCG